MQQGRIMTRDLIIEMSLSLLDFVNFCLIDYSKCLYPKKLAP